LKEGTIMPLADCTIVVERLGDNHYRASCPLFPDCQAVAATEEAASQAVAEAIQRILRERDEVCEKGVGSRFRFQHFM
jgi:predicted RNase H-like HicB family nuclease